MAVNRDAGWVDARSDRAVPVTQIDDQQEEGEHEDAHAGKGEGDPRPAHSSTLASADLSSQAR